MSQAWTRKGTLAVEPLRGKFDPVYSEPMSGDKPASIEEMLQQICDEEIALLRPLLESEKQHDLGLCEILARAEADLGHLIREVRGERVTYTREELAELADGLQGLLDGFEATGDPHDRAIRARVEGAVIVLRMLAEGNSQEISSSLLR